jgi:putative tryptophan/tyrosine transport system substrate-binding protein
LIILGGTAAWPFAARTQTPTKVARIGFLAPGYSATSALRVERMWAGLRDLGYVEGKNIVIESRWAEGNYDRLPELAAELVRLNIDVLVTYGTPGALAAKQATTTIPIVVAVMADAIRSGLVASLSRPGGNLTGQTFFVPELNAKRLELLKEALPDSRRIVVLVQPTNPTPALEMMGLTAKSLGLELQQFEARGPDELKGAFSAMVARSVDAVVVVEDPKWFDYARSIGELVTAQRLPSIGFLEIAEAGGLLAYGVDQEEMFVRAAVFVAKILKGAKPAELPVEQPTRFKFVINLKAANALGLTMPYMLSGRADEVIE